MITIKAKREGFRRCGVAHPLVETSYPDDRFNEEELSTLENEPMLDVSYESNNSSVSTGYKANEAINVIKTINNNPSLDEFGQGEERKSVLAAIEARRKELEA